MFNNASSHNLGFREDNEGEEDSRRDKLQVERLHVKDDAKDEEDEMETEKRKKSKYEVTTN